MKIKPIQLNQFRKNKRGQIESIILLVITIVIIGIIVFFANHVNRQIYSSLNDKFQEDAEYNNTEVQQVTQKLEDVETSNIWDWVFFAIFIGLNIQMIIFSFASKQSLVFFWLFVIIGIVVLMLAIVLSNIWQSIAVNPEFAVTITRFPIMNLVLGSYFPVIITGVFYLALIVLFGKFPGQEE